MLTSPRFGTMPRVLGTAFAAVVAFASILIAGGVQANAQGISLANYDLQGSGYVVPAGMPAMGIPGGPGGVTPVGYCDSGCDTMSMMPAMDRMVCGSCGGGGGCDCNGILGGGGLLGKMRSGGGPACLFCRGAGCTACRETPFGYAGSVLAGAASLLSPYSEASLCNQRWYDVSLEGMFLSREIDGGVPGVIATDGVNGTPALTLDDVGEDDLEGGVRASVAFLWGPGGNIEGVYMGGNEWSGTASATSGTDSLYSFISDYGVTPNNGYDDTDRSSVQSLVSRSAFHSAELNYRRRAMFPYCRFQSSWLFGLRYVRYDDSLLYSTSVNGDPTRFFESDTSSKNHLFGPQVGFDFWWNVCSGISVGVGSKTAWVQNDIDRRTYVRSNSLGIGATPGSATVSDFDQDTTFMADFELKMIYRLTYSLAVRSSYYVLAVDDIVYGGLDQAAITNIFNTTNVDRSFVYDDLVLQGFTVGAEYTW
ncbi:BBP7 family outer membrane beta-barrel protein [Roseiconus lacunae]|uniref:BBP7 family outer membrane beta-barrel protein n=1 Tax=Roseiconus lacunae TaxID=2605694 RepID=A0ABT7PCP2_9BACT|nr:BBP7 family outer membrane beta-barrel protein [Roseiconus lacunae]MDM4014241.1 BBP7 family outer membrane beta-barrel protein [Roseiconus lacunae]